MKKNILTLSLLCALCACSSSDDAETKDMTYPVITDQGITYPTSRFVSDYSLFTLSSLTLSYDFRNCRFVRNSFLERLKISAYTNDLFVISSVKTERGTDYPFARTFSLSAQVTF